MPLRPTPPYFSISPERRSRQAHCGRATRRLVGGGRKPRAGSRWRGKIGGRRPQIEPPGRRGAGGRQLLRADGASGRRCRGQRRGGSPRQDRSIGQSAFSMVSALETSN